MLETHLGSQDHDKMVQWFSARGWQAIGEAAAQSAKGSTHGGSIALFPKHCHTHVHCAQRQYIDGCGWLAVQWEFQEISLIIIMVYMKCGEGLQGSTN